MSGDQDADERCFLFDPEKETQGQIDWWWMWDTHPASTTDGRSRSAEVPGGASESDTKATESAIRRTHSAPATGRVPMTWPWIPIEAAGYLKEPTATYTGEGQIYADPDPIFAAHARPISISSMEDQGCHGRTGPRRKRAGGVRSVSVGDSVCSVASSRVCQPNPKRPCYVGNRMVDRATRRLVTRTYSGEWLATAPPDDSDDDQVEKKLQADTGTPQDHDYDAQAKGSGKGKAGTVTQLRGSAIIIE